MTGSVTISIKDFDKLRNESTIVEDRKSRLTRARSVSVLHVHKGAYPRVLR
jgi:hypothetical protein